MAEFERQPLAGERKVAIERSYSLRETINSNFDKVRSLADGLLFEFGLSRQKDFALRGQIREWQPQRRMLFVTRITLFKYRLQFPGFELPSAVCDLQLEFDSQLAATLERIADRLEEKAPGAIMTLEIHLLLSAFASINAIVSVGYDQKHFCYVGGLLILSKSSSMTQ
jgi:multidrug resistance protein MdtO